MTNPYQNEKLYTSAEVLQILTGLMYAYWTKPWYIRWFHKPWLDALQTAALIIAGKEIIAIQETKDFLNSIHTNLGENE